MTQPLSELKPGQEATVVELRGEDETIERLMEMGVVEGSPLKVIRFAPLGDPVEIAIRGYHLTLRKTEAAGVIVEL